MTKDQIIYRDTITGQTVTAEYAKAHPDTTVRETRKAGKWRRRAEAAEAKLDAVREIARDVATDAGDDKSTYGEDYHAGMVTVAARIMQALSLDALDGTEPR